MDGGRDNATLGADLSDAVHAAAELANLRFSKVIGARSDVHAALPLAQFVQIFSCSWDFVVQCEVVCHRMIVGLRGVMVGQAKAFLVAFHSGKITASAKQVELEQWSPTDVPAASQTILNLIIESAVSDPPALVIDHVPQANGIAEAPPAKQLEVEGNPYFAVGACLKALDALADYIRVLINLPLLTTDSMSKVVEFLKVRSMPSPACQEPAGKRPFAQQFNSRTCQVVLGAGAMRSAGLKNITARHLALASQALSIMISLIPYVREALRRHLNAKQAVMLIEFDKLKRDYQEHQNEIHAKLVAIMADRLAAHAKSLQVKLRSD